MGLFEYSESEAAGPLTEEQFFAGLEGAFKYGTRGPAGVVISPRQLAKAHEEAYSLEREADAYEARFLRLSRGWRRVRLLARFKALQGYYEADRQARAMRGTFGWPDG